MNPHVLVAEDHPTMREAVRMVLVGEGYRVTDAADGAAALDAIARDAPDVVVLDLHMPVMDGAEVLIELRARPETAGLPVIVVTADGDEGRAAAERLGATDYVTKPFDPGSLLRAVARALGADGSPGA
jgi:CheY-like chemotaxis protein